MQNAKNAATRKRLYAAFVNRQAGPNTTLLEEAIRVRQECARELGYASWADYRLDGRMAKDTTTVCSFLNGLKEPVKEKIRSDLTSLLSLKQELEPGADRVEPWDLAVLTEQERKRKFALDNEEIRKDLPVRSGPAGNVRAVRSALRCQVLRSTKNPGLGTGYPADPHF